MFSKVTRFPARVFVSVTALGVLVISWPHVSLTFSSTTFLSRYSWTISISVFGFATALSTTLWETSSKTPAKGFSWSVLIWCPAVSGALFKNTNAARKNKFTTPTPILEGQFYTRKSEKKKEIVPLTKKPSYWNSLSGYWDSLYIV